MRAAVIRKHGGPECVEVGEIDRPVPAAGEVLIEVRAAAMNHLDIWMRQGTRKTDADGRFEVTGLPANATAGCMLSKEGYAVETAATAAEGMAKIRAGGIDLIILDVMMALDTEGFQVAQDLKSDPELKDIPILMMTSVSA